MKLKLWFLDKTKKRTRGMKTDLLRHVVNFFSRSQNNSLSALFAKIINCMCVCVKVTEIHIILSALKMVCISQCFPVVKFKEKTFINQLSTDLLLHYKTHFQNFLSNTNTNKTRQARQ